MDINNLPIMTAIKKRLNWLNTNQKVISQNIANADTPGFTAQKLKRQDFSNLVNAMDDSKKGIGETRSAPGPKHQFSTIGGAQSGVAVKSKDAETETSPTGNSVVLEEEMMKMADNQMQYSMAINLYRKNVGLLKTALGKGGR